MRLIISGCALAAALACLWLFAGCQPPIQPPAGTASATAPAETAIATLPSVPAHLAKPSKP